MRDTGVRVARFCFVERGVNTETFFALREVTVVFTALRAVVVRAERDGFATVCEVDFPRDTAFSVRDAASALKTQTNKTNIKYRIFFISCVILANL